MCAATESHTKKSPRLFIVDQIREVRCLVDSGSDITVIPLSLAETVNNQVAYVVVAANGEEIRVHGTKIITFDLGFNIVFNWNVIVADVAYPMIGADFLKHFHLIPDLTKRLLISGQNGNRVDCKEGYSSQPSVHLITDTKEGEKAHKILSAFPNLMKPPRYHNVPLHATYHYIETTGPPVHQRSYRLPPRERENVEKAYRAMT